MHVVSQGMRSFLNMGGYFIAGLKNAKDLVKMMGPSLEKDVPAEDHALLTAKTKEAYLEVLTQKVPYRFLRQGDKIARSVHLPDMPQYKVHKVLEDPCGMKGIFLVPEQLNSGHAPLLLFRGTDPKNFNNILDDLRMYPAGLNFKRQKRAIGEELQEISLKYGAVHVSGYSFGAAMAQKTTAAFPEYITCCTSFNGLNAGAKTAKLFREKMQQYPAGMQKPIIEIYRHAKDVVSLLGGESLPTTPGRHITFGSTKDSLSNIKAHSVLSISQNLKMRRDVAPNRRLGKIMGVVERIRQAVGNVVAYFVKQPLRPRAL